MNAVWVALGFLLIGVSAGSLSVWAYYQYRVMPSWREQQREVLVNARRRKLHDNGRHLPRRPEATGRPAKVHRVKIRDRYGARK